MKFCAILLTFLLSATAAMANTVTLDFGQGFQQQSSNFGLGGTWNSGFNLTATTAETLFPGDVANISRVSSNQTGFTQNVNSLTISRSDNQTFSLKSLNIPGFMSNVFADWSGTDKATGQRVTSFVPMLMNIVSMVGTKADGTVVSQSLLPTNASTVETSNQFSSAGFWSNPNPIFPVSGLTQLVSLQLKSAFDFSNKTLCQPVNLARVDPRFAQSGFCSGTVNPNGPLTGVSAFLDTGGRNDLSYFDFGGATFTIAAVPLPAGAVFLLTGLIGLGWLTGSRKRSITTLHS